MDRFRSPFPVSARGGAVSHRAYKRQERITRRAGRMMHTYRITKCLASRMQQRIRKHAHTTSVAPGAISGAFAQFLQLAIAV